MKARSGIIVGVAILLLAAVFVLVWSSQKNPAQPIVAVPFSQDVYVWQRDWTPAVRTAVLEQGTTFRRFVLLSTEINGDSVVELKPEYAAAGRSVGIAVRVGPDAGREGVVVPAVVKAVAAVRSAGVDVAEVQVDYDCPDSKLGDYRRWISAVADAVRPTPVVITALPTWLNRDEFKDLAHAADSFVLQVHSLHRPGRVGEPLTLCDPVEARAAVAKASTIGVRFRVALPTYGYTVAFKPTGEFFGLWAEGPSPQWPAGTRLADMRADPTQLAELVRDWSARPPADCDGLIWYRLPVAGDRLNWSAPTLRAVAAGQTPAPALRLEGVRTKPGLIDVFATNTGDGDADLPAVAVEWDRKVDASAEPLGEFTVLEQVGGRVIFMPNRVDPLRPGGRVQVGWVRLGTDTEVRIHVVQPTH